MKEALTFDDVLMVPAFNKYPSRNDERINTSVKLGNFTFETPIISANMDTITGSKMARKMAELSGLGILHRFCNVEDNMEMYLEAALGPKETRTTNKIHNIGVSIGVNEGLGRASVLYASGARIFCVDVAHGHSKACGHMVRDLRKEFGSEILIIAGNVCTYAGCDCLIGYGVDAIKVGIGPGCFTPNSQVRTNKGLKSIQHIEIGDKVQTHTGQFQEVTALFNRAIFKENSEDIIQVNDIHCTLNHEFRVVDKSKQHEITETNIQEYAYWVPASELDKDKHLLIELE